MDEIANVHVSENYIVRVSNLKRVSLYLIKSKETVDSIEICIRTCFKCTVFNLKVKKRKHPPFSFLKMSREKIEL